MARGKGQSRQDEELPARVKSRKIDNLVSLHKLPAMDKERLVQELGIHRVELQTQNEELRRVQLELEAARSRYFELFDLAPVGYFILDEKGRVTEANITGVKLLGATKADLLMKSFTHWVAPESQDSFLLHRRETVSTGLPRTCELKLRKGDGSEFVGELISQVELDKEGNFKQLRSTLLDITERKKAEEALRQSEKRFKMTIENSHAAICVVDLKGVPVIVNKAFENMMGYPSEELLELDFTRYTHPDDLEREILLYKELVCGIRDSYTIEKRNIRKDGKHVWMRFNVTAVRDEQHEISYLISVGVDVTEQKMAEEKLRDYQAKLKDMASRILNAEDDERRRIAVGMHDNICQKLVVSKMALDSSLKLIGDIPAASSLTIVSESIGDAIEEADSLTFSLSSPVLYELGLVAAIKDYLEREIRRKHGIAVELESDIQLCGLKEQVRNVLFRIVRELLVNVVKHARASKVRVCVHKSGDQLELSVKDNGVGFRPDELGRKARFGLFSVREQLEHFAGRLEIESKPGRGTTATVVLPLENLSIE